MYRVAVPSTINRIVALFYGLRVWNHNEGSFCATVLKLLQAINFVSFVLSIIIGAAISPHIEEVVFLTDFAILTGTHTVRLVYIVWKKDEILQFIDAIGIHHTDAVNESIRVKNKISALLKFAEIFVFACSVDVFLVMIYPIFSSGSIINIAFPWEKSGLAFWISHFFVSVGCVYAVICFLVTVIIWYLLLNCSLKYQLLGNQLRSIGKTDTKVKELKACSPELKACSPELKACSPEKQRSCEEDLIKAIRAHRIIRSTIEHFSSTFTIFFFIQIMTSSLAICTGVYNLAFSSHEDLLSDIFNTFFSMYNFFDILVLMYLGNEIKLSSDRLSYCLFQSNWIDQSPTSKMYIIIMTEVLKRPHEMIILKLYPLNLQMFTSIVNGAYSMFNVLRQ